MTLSTIAPAVLNDLVDALKEREGLQQVSVTSGPLGTASAPAEKLEFWRIVHDQDFATWGSTQGRPSRGDDFGLTGAVWVSVPSAGEDTIRQARSRAYEIWAELSDYLRENPKLGRADVLKAQLKTGEVDQFAGDQKRMCQIEFRIEVSARI